MGSGGSDENASSTGWSRKRLPKKGAKISLLIIRRNKPCFWPEGLQKVKKRTLKGGLFEFTRIQGDIGVMPEIWETLTVDMGGGKIESVQSPPLAVFSMTRAFQISADILLIINSSPGNLSERLPSLCL